MSPQPILRNAELDPAPILQCTVAILGYGNQGRPQALNLRDSGVKVIVGARATSTQRPQAEADGFPVYGMAEAAQQAEVIMMLLPDEVMADVYAEIQALTPGKYLGFSHGLAIHAGWVQPQPEVNVFLVAPKAQGRGVRSKYLAGTGVPALYAVHQDPAQDTREVALAYAWGLGCGRVGILPTSFQEETVSDLFSEQAVLCGGLTRLIQAAFETLVENGFSPEVAYFECLYEVKLIGDLLHERGITGMRQAISSTALFGDLSRGERVIDAHTKENMRRVLEDITSGRFAQEMRREFDAGKPFLQERLAAEAHHPIEETHRQLADSLFKPQ